MTFSQAISAAFGNGLTLRRAAVAVFNQAFLFQAITAAFSYVLALWGTVVAIFSNALTLWSAFVTVGSDFVAFDQTVRTAFGQGLGEHAVAGLDLWSGLFSGGQGEGVGSQNG